MINSQPLHLNRRELLVAGAGAITAISLPAAGLAAETGGYEAVTVSDGVTVSGAVFFSGEPPQGQQVLIGKDNHVCGDGHTEQNPVRVSAGRLADAVVFLEGIERGKPWPDQGVAEVTQEGCAFHPYVQVARRGADLTITNIDPLLHNIHGYELIGRARRTMFNVAQPQAGQVDVQPMTLRRGEVVELACDAHNWMSAWIQTLDHPYGVLVGADGSFALADVPPGAYRLVAWHPALGTQVAEIEVEDGRELALDLTFTA